ncbi:MAG: ABC transporter substrate-binding protein [Solirubrobacterales bacterium]|nr:ABC transporter substrate-binding protein [Solirubrobacterales bacterium]
MTDPFEPGTAVNSSFGELTRREVLGRGAGFGLGLTGLGALLSACGGGSSASAHLNKNAVLKFSMSTTIPGLDAQKWWNGAAACGQHAMYESLLTLDPYSNGNLVPLVATGLPKVENNSMRYTFTLRPGVKFSNGMSLTSADYKYAFERLVIPSFGSEIGPLFTSLPIVGMADVLNQKAKTLSGITTPDPHTIVFDFDVPDSAFIYVNSHYMAGAVPKAMVEQVGFGKFNWAPVGTGPFTVDVINRQSSISLKRNKNYWNSAVPRYAGVSWKLGIDDTLGMIRIQSGQDDMMYDPVPSGFIASVLNPKYVSDHQTVITPQNNCYWLSLSLRDPVLKNLKVRQAIAMAVDKPRILRAMHQLGEVANGTFFSPLSPYFDDGAAYSYNPSAAKSLLASAKLPSGSRVKMWSSNRWPYESVAQVILADLTAIGLNVDYIPMEYDAFVTQAGTLPAGMLLWAYELLYPHGSYIVDTSFTTAGIAGFTNYSYVKSPTIDKLAKEGHRATNKSDIASIYKQIGRIVVRDQVLWVPLVYPHRPDFVSTRVRDFRASASYGEDQERFFYKYAMT